ncbi:MAG: hypothetical protein Q9195_004220 [Heterodermia aff. obscurata]
MMVWGLQRQASRRNKSVAEDSPQLPAPPSDAAGGVIETFVASMQNRFASLKPKRNLKSTDQTVLASEGTTYGFIASPKSSEKKLAPSDDGLAFMMDITDCDIASPQAPKNDFVSTTNAIPDSISPSIPDIISPSIPDSISSSIPDIISPSIPNSISPSIPQTIPSAASVSAASGDHANSKLKEMARDLFVDFELSIPTALFHEWESRVRGPLLDALCRSLPDVDFALEFVMARSSIKGNAKPTILLACSTLEHQKRIQRVLRRCDFVPGLVRWKVVVQELKPLTLGSSSDIMDAVPQHAKVLVDIAISKAGESPVLFGKLAKLYCEKDVESTSFSTIGGVVSVAGELYGLTTAHGIESIGTRRQEGPRASDFAKIGHIECSDWSPGNKSKSAESGPTIQTGSDWALVRLQAKDLASKNFRLPALSPSQEVTGYLKNKDMGAGQVTVHAGVSGIQQAFLSGKTSHVVMAGRVFLVRSMSLEVPLETVSYVDMSLHESVKAYRGRICYQLSQHLRQLQNTGIITINMNATLKLRELVEVQRQNQSLRHLPHVLKAKAADPMIQQ